MCSRATLAFVLFTLVGLGAIPAVADAAAYTWIGGDGLWQSAGLWAPIGGPPGLGDSASIHGPRQVSLDNDVQGLSGLVLTGGATLYTADLFSTSQLTAVNLTGTAVTTVFGNGAAGPNTRMMVYANSSPGFIGDVVNLHNGGELRLIGDATVRVTNNMDVDALSVIRGHGTIDFSNTHNVTGTRLALGGTVQPDNNDQITLDAMGGSLGVHSSAQLDVGPGSSISLAGTATVISGGTWTGEGSIFLDADLTTIAAPTTVNMPAGTFDLDGGQIADTLAINAPFTLNVDAVDSFFIQDRIDDRVQINGAAGQLNVQFTDPLRNYAFGTDLDLNGPGGGLTGIHLAGSDVELLGITNVTGSSTSQARITFSGRTVIAAGGELNLQSNTARPNVINTTASWGGDGELHIRPGSRLTAADTSIIGVDLRNRGRFDPGSQAADVTITENYIQESVGTLGYHIAGPPGVSHDFLHVQGNAFIGGAVEVSTINGFVPSAGDVYTILTADGTNPALGVFGTFDSLTIDAGPLFDVQGVLIYHSHNVFLTIQDVEMWGDFNDDLALDCADVDALVAEIASGGMGQAFDLNDDMMVDHHDLDLWLATAGTFNVGGPYLPGDANLDGFVDGFDYLIFNQHKFTATAAWCAADFNADGFTNGLDFLIWNEFKFMSSDAASAVPEPMGVGWLAWLVFLAVVRVRRRRG